MPFRLSTLFCSLLAAGHVVADLTGPDTKDPCAEEPSFICYYNAESADQMLSVQDVAAAAGYLRSLGGPNSTQQLLTMPAGDFSCGEQTLYSAGTVKATAKHVEPRVNSSVLYSDIANTIDGGPNPTSEDRKNSILGCATRGGQGPVRVDASNPVYSSAGYKESGATPQGIVIKVSRR